MAAFNCTNISVLLQFEVFYYILASNCQFRKVQVSSKPYVYFFGFHMSLRYRIVSQMTEDSFMCTDKGIKPEYNLYLLYILLNLSRLQCLS